MKPLVFTVFVLLSGWLVGQDIGLHPPEIDWQQIRAENVRVIYPEGYAARAQRVASMIDRLATDHNRSVGERLYDFDLVLQTPNMTVNGYVGLAPFRSEFYTTPPQSFSRLSNTDWLDLLTIHEFRHVQQTSNQRRGLTKWASFLQGQLGWMVLSGIATPNWFTEGDAVVAETALTAGGRGRTPAFSSDLRALLRNNTIYRYAKARNGSFRSLVPSHYVYGYAMTTFARERFGNDVWKPVLQKGAAYRSLIYPFSRALKRRTDLTTRGLYFNTMAELEQLQDSALAAREPLIEGERLGSADKDIRNYQFPFVDGKGRLLALRTSYRQLPALVEVGVPDRVITYTGIQREPWLAGSDRFVLWTQYAQHPRYTNQNFSDLVVYEISTGRQRKITEGGHYVSATFSPDERRLAAVWFDALDGFPELRVLNAADGTVLNEIKLEENNAAWPVFSADGAQIFFLAQNYEGVAVKAWDVVSNRVSTLLPRSAAPIDMLSVAEDGRLLFTSGLSGVDNIFSLEPGTGAFRQLTDVAIGAYYPYISEETLYYAAPTPFGERLRQLRLTDTGRPMPTVQPQTSSDIFQRPKAFAEERANLPVELEVSEYPTKNFSNTLGGIKLHSWSFNGSYITPGLAVEFGNALNTATVTLEGEYNFNENRYGGGLNVAYGGLFPVIEFQGLYQDRSTVVQADRADSLLFFGQEFNQLVIGPTVRVPLQWVEGNTSTTVIPSVGYQYYSVQDQEEGSLPPDFGNLSLGLQFSTLRRMAFKQVQPRFGATARIAYDRGLGAGATSERLLLRSSLYLPGLFRTHGVRLDLDAQTEQATNLFQYADIFTYARGFTAPLNDRVFRIGGNYQLPLLYPDIGILGITYFKRVRLNAFYDYSQFTLDFRDDLTFTESSVGGQLYFDNVWLNTQLITLGVQVAYRLNQDVFSAGDNDLQFRVLLSGSF